MIRFLAGIAALMISTAAAQAQGDAGSVVLRSDRVWGHPDAPVLLIEYSSHTCPHCATAHETLLPEILETYVNQGAVKLVVRPMPLDQTALVGALLSYCLPAEAYYPFTEELYATQNTWIRTSDPSGVLVALAQSHGLSAEEAAACLQDEATRTLVANYAVQAQQSLGVRGTPTYFVNGKQSNAAQVLARIEAAVPVNFQPQPYIAPWLLAEDMAESSSTNTIVGEQAIVEAQEFAADSDDE